MPEAVSQLETPIVQLRWHVTTNSSASTPRRKVQNITVTAPDIFQASRYVLEQGLYPLKISLLAKCSAELPRVLARQSIIQTLKAIHRDQVLILFGGATRCTRPQSTDQPDSHGSNMTVLRWHYSGYDQRSHRKVNGNLDGPSDIAETCYQLFSQGVFPVTVFLTSKSRDHLDLILAQQSVQAMLRDIHRRKQLQALHVSGKIVTLSDHRKSQTP